MHALLIATMTFVGGFDVHVDRGGRLHRLEGGTGRNVALSYRRSDDGGATWSTPTRVDGGRPAYRFSAGDVRVAAEGETAIAMWTAPGKGPFGSGPLAVARSTDGGCHWSPAASPAGHGPIGRRFPALAISSGVVQAVWLDRESNAKVLVSRSGDGARSWSAPVVLDADACECCWNAAFADERGSVYVLYRDKDPRDMKAAVSRDAGLTWGPSAPAGDFGWGFSGCPHVGGALAATPSGMMALVWTGKDGAAGLYVAALDDWSRREKLGGPGAKHADLASSCARLAAAWDEGGAIFVSVNSGTGAWSAPRRLSAADVEAGHPRVVCARGSFHIFWIERDGPRAASRLAGTSLKI
ncbi:MAG: exo-alpha-sialidase [Elusimicrobia bacterium]|nr:exo-alpha-sialidase [Elusimicrobiota bacterium]